VLNTTPAAGDGWATARSSTGHHDGVADIPDEVIRDLYAGTPEQFVATRDAAVAAARAAGDKALAAAIGALRKPTLGAWLVNVLALRRPDDLAGLFALGDELRAAQRDLRGADLRQLSARRHAVVAGLVERARQLAAGARPGASDAALPWDEVTATLNAALSDAETAVLVRAGRLLRTTAYAGFGEAPTTLWATPDEQETGPGTARPDRAAKGGGRAAEPGPPAHRKPTPADQRAAPDDRSARARERAHEQAREQAKEQAREQAEERARERAEERAAREADRRAREEYDLAAAGEEDVRGQLDEVEQALTELRGRKVDLQAELGRRRSQRQAAQRAVTAATRRLQRAQDNVLD
jgi:hypothetical protein